MAGNTRAGTAIGSCGHTGPQEPLAAPALYTYSLDWLQSETLTCLKKNKRFSLLIFTYGEINFLPKQILPS